MLVFKLTELRAMFICSEKPNTWCIYFFIPRIPCVFTIFDGFQIIGDFLMNGVMVDEYYSVKYDNNNDLSTIEIKLQNFHNRYNDWK